MAQVKAGELPEHLKETLMGGSVKAVQGLDLFQSLRVHPLRPPITQAAALGTDAFACLGFGQVLLDRAAGHKLNDHKGE